MTLKVDVENDEEIIRALDEDVLLAGPMKTFLNTLALTGQNEARKHAKPHGGDTGTLARSIQVRLDPGPVPMGAQVYTDLTYAAPAEFGRAPGRPPPVAAMEEFARRHGLPEGIGFVLARAIGRKGTRGLHFMKKGADAIEAKYSSAASVLASDVEKIFGSKT